VLRKGFVEECSKPLTPIIKQRKKCK